MNKKCAVLVLGRYALSYPFLGLALLHIRWLLSGIDGKLERKEFWLLIIGTIGTVVPGTIYTVDYIANHWPSISIPFPQGNATTSQYVTIVMPRPLPPAAGWTLLGVIGASFVAAVALRVYWFLRPEEIVIREAPEIVVEKDEAESEPTQPTVTPRPEPPESAIAQCLNCGNKFYARLSSLTEPTLHVDARGISWYADCPSCGKSVLVYIPPKT
jgi:hypothetical protein